MRLLVFNTEPNDKINTQKIDRSAKLLKSATIHRQQNHCIIKLKMFIHVHVLEIAIRQICQND